MGPTGYNAVCDALTEAGIGANVTPRPTDRKEGAQYVVIEFDSGPIEPVLVLNALAKAGCLHERGAPHYEFGSETKLEPIDDIVRPAHALSFRDRNWPISE